MIPRKTLWTGILLSPLILLLVWCFQSNPKKQEDSSAKAPIATFDFIPTLPKVPVSTKSFIHISQEDGTKKDIQLQTFKGKPTIVHFWATWCGACVGEMPELNEFAHQYGKDINLVVIASDHQTGGQAAKEFFANKKLTNLQLYVDTTTDLIRSFKIQGLPTTIFLNEAAEEIGRVTGPIEWSGDSGTLIKETLVPTK